MSRRWWQRRWARIASVGGAVLVVVLILAMMLGTWVARPFIVARLQRELAPHTDATLRVGSLSYSFPLSATLRDVKLVASRGDRTVDLLSANRLSVRFEAAPWQDGPLRVGSIEVDSPVAHLVRTENGFIGERADAPDLGEVASGAPGTRDSPGEVHERFSDDLRLGRLTVTGGRVVYEDARSGLPVSELVTWDRIDVDVTGAGDADRPGAYNCRLAARSGATSIAEVAALIDLDNLSGRVEQARLLLDIAAKPEPQDGGQSRSAVPYEVRQLVEEQGLSGTVELKGVGEAAFGQIEAATASAVIELNCGGSFRLPGADAPLDELSARLQLALDRASSNPAGAAEGPRIGRVTIERAVARGGDTQVQCVGGSLILNQASDAWGLHELRLILTPGSARSPSLPRRVRELADRHDCAAAGRVGVEINGSGPAALSRDSLAGCNLDAKFYPENLVLTSSELPASLREFAPTAVRMADGLISLQAFSCRYDQDVVAIDGASVPVKGLPAALTVDQLAGSVTFSPTPARYPPALEEWLSQARPRGQLWFRGSARFDLSDRPAHSAASDAIDYKLRVLSERLSVSGSHGRMPLYNVAADVTLEPGAVAIDRFNASVLAGTLSLTGRVGLSGETPDYTANVRIRQVDLNALAGALARPGDEPITIRGELHADLSVRGAGFDEERALNALVVDGAASITNGELMQVPVIEDIAQLIHVPRAANVGEAGCTFKLVERVVSVSELAVGSPAIGIKGAGKVGLDGALDLNVIATPFRDWDRQLRRDGNAVANAAADVFGAVQRGVNAAAEGLLYRVHVGGTTSQPEVNVIAAPALQGK